MKTFDEMIATALDKTFDERYEDYLEVKKKHRFSLSYKKRRHDIKRSFNAAHIEHKPLTLRKIKYGLIAVMIGVYLAFSLGFSEWDTYGSFLFNDKQIYSTVYIVGPQEEKTSIEEMYVLPDEYELINVEADETEICLTYMIDGYLVYVVQNLFSIKDNVNTENREIEYTYVGDYEGFYIQVTETDCLLCFLMDGYKFFVIGRMDKNTAFLLAESLKIKDFEENAS